MRLSTGTDNKSKDMFQEVLNGNIFFFPSPAHRVKPPRKITMVRKNKNIKKIIIMSKGRNISTKLHLGSSGDIIRLF